MHAVTLDEARDQLPAQVEKAIKGEQVVILKDAAPAVKLVAMRAKPKLGQPRLGSAKGQVFMADDFEAPLEDFREYME